MNDKQLEPFKTAEHVYIIGNGGSYANAVHIANDLLSSGIRAHTLDPASLTASANDFGYETVFDRWVCVVGQPGDLLIALSGSGKSPNILTALATAKAIGMTTWAVFGAYNQHDDAVADIITRAGDNMQTAEEHQLVWGHEIMRRLKDNLSQTVGLATVRGEKEAA